MINVAAAIIWQDEKLLICKRPAGTSLPLLWELPGGKIEKNESPEQAIVRECYEELGVIVEAKDIFDNSTYNYDNSEISFTFINAKITKGIPKNIEHEEIKWVDINELDNYEFCPADIEILERIKQDGV